MGQARHPPSLSLAAGVALALVAGLVASGCGSSDGGGSTAGTARSGSGEGGPGPAATAPGAPPGVDVALCGGSVAGAGRVRASGAGCAVARGVVASWSGKRACGRPASGSRVSCTVGGYRCLGAATERGLAVTCSRRGSSIAFLARRG